MIGNVTELIFTCTTTTTTTHLPRERKEWKECHVAFLLPPTQTRRSKGMRETNLEERMYTDIRSGGGGIGGDSSRSYPA